MAELTTLAKVKLFDNHGDADDAALTSLITAVSDAIEIHLARVIDQVSGILEVWRATGESPDLLLREWPVENTAITELGVLLVEDTDYEVVGDRLVRRLDGDQYRDWPRGRIPITYDGGYTTIPSDIELSANEQVIWEFKRSGASGSALAGKLSKDLGQGATEEYETDGLIKSVVQRLARHRRIGGF